MGAALTFEELEHAVVAINVAFIEGAQITADPLNDVAA